LDQSEPHAYTIILAIVVVAMVLTWVVPAGNFERAYNEELDRELVVPGSYQPAERSPVGPWGMIKALYEGLTDASDIIFFILIAYGYVFILLKTGAIDALVGAMLRKLGNNDKLLIPAFMILFEWRGPPSACTRRPMDSSPPS
jgi:uncharacterized ion transporter superfamily protein YfcC